MTTLQIIFLIVWGVFGVHAWLISFQSWFVWWLTAGPLDKIGTALMLLVLLGIGLVLGPASYVLWQVGKEKGD